MCIKHYWKFIVTFIPILLLLCSLSIVAQDPELNKPPIPSKDKKEVNESQRQDRIDSLKPPIVHNNEEPRDTVLIHLESSLREARTDSLKISALSELGLYQIDKDFIKAEDYLNEALKLIQSKLSNAHIMQLGVVYDHLGVVRRRQARYSDAISYYLKAKEIFEKTQDSIHLASILHNMGVAYRFLDKHTESIAYLKEALTLKKALN